MRKQLLGIVAALTAAVISGCGTAASETALTEQPSSVPENQHLIEDIQARGYLIAGCKTNVPELSYFNEDTGEWSGLEIEIAYKTAAAIFNVSETEAKEKQLVEFVGVTVADREDMLSSGDIDCMLATYTITPQRQEKFQLSDSYYTSYIGLMVLDMPEDADTLGSAEIASIADLDGKYIGVPRNATTRKDFIDYLNMTSTTVTPVFCEYESYDILYNALKNGNIDAIAVDTSILSGYDDDTTKILNDRFAPQHYGAAVTQENRALIPYLNQAINS